MKISLVLLLSSEVLRLVNGVTSCKLFHKKDIWHNWNKWYYRWIKLPTLGKQRVNFITCGCESSAPFLAHLTQRVMWGIAITWRPSSVRSGVKHNQNKKIKLFSIRVKSWFKLKRKIVRMDEQTLFMARCTRYNIMW
jgi:hypothetical protein